MVFDGFLRLRAVGAAMVMRMHEWSRASAYWTGAVNVNPILQTNPNGASAMLAAAPVPSQRGGFASTLAAAQNSSTAPHVAENQTGGSHGFITASPKDPVNPAVNVPAAQGVPPKKALSSNSTGPATFATGVTSPVPSPDPNPSQPSLPAPGISAQDGNATATVPIEMPSAATTAQNLLSGFSLPTQPGIGNANMSQATGPAYGRGALMTGGVGSSTAPAPNLVSVSVSVSSPNAVTPTNVVGSDVLPNDALQNNVLQSNIAPSDLLANNVLPGGVLLNTVPASNDPRDASNGSQANGLGAASQPVTPTPAAPAPQFQVTLETSQPVLSCADSARAALTTPSDLVAGSKLTAGTSNANQIAVPQSAQTDSSGVGTPATPAPTLLAQILNPQLPAASSANAAVLDTAQPSLSTGAGSTSSSNVSAPNSAPLFSNLPGPVAAGSDLFPAAAANVAGAAAGAGKTTPPPALPGSDPGSGAASSQTPFSVFFSGSGTESAVSALPKMILPATGAGGRDSHATITAASIFASQSGAQATVSQSAPPQNGNGNSNSNNKNVHAGTPSPSLMQTVQPPHLGGDAGAAGVQAAAPAVPPPAPAATATTLSLGGQAPPAAELSKAGPQPASAPDAPARAVPLAPEQAAVVPGPVQVAQMVSRMGQSEMRIGMNTSAFGSVEVRTVVHANDVGLIIGSEKGDLRTLLANDLPAITHSLQQQNVRLNSVNFMEGFAFSNNASGGGDSQARSFVPMRTFANSGSREASPGDSREAVATGDFEGGHSSLSILA